MSLIATCSCGKKYQLKDELAGKRVKCPACLAVIQIPNPEPLVAETWDFGPLDDPLNSPALPHTTLPAMNPYADQVRPASVDAGHESAGGGFSTRRMLMIVGGVLGGVMLLACGLCGLGVYMIVRPPPVSAEARQPYNLASVPVPPMVARGEPRQLQDGIRLFEVRLGQADGRPGHGQRTWLYLPPGEHPAGSLPCVLIAPAGSTLLTGMALAEGDQPEHLPYVQAGMAVVAFELDGIEDYGAFDEEAAFREEDWEDVEDYELKSYTEFRASQAGMVNARNALEFVLAEVPEVNPRQIFVAGHSSAGTLSLLFAAHEPRLAGSLAYAPAYDLWERFTPVGIRMLGNVYPELADFVTQSSPKTHIAHVRCPVFLFHAEDDSNVPAEDSRNCEAALREAGTDVTLDIVTTGDHYDSMITQGIPHGIQWIQSRTR